MQLLHACKINEKNNSEHWNTEVDDKHINKQK